MYWHVWFLSNRALYEELRTPFFHFVFQKKTAWDQSSSSFKKQWEPSDKISGLKCPSAFFFPLCSLKGFTSLILKEMSSWASSKEGLPSEMLCHPCPCKLPLPSARPFVKWASHYWCFLNISPIFRGFSSPPFLSPLLFSSLPVYRCFVLFLATLLVAVGFCSSSYTGRN